MSKELDEAYATIELAPLIKRIKELEAKIEAANKILEPKIDAQQHLINSGSEQAVYTLYFSKQELITLSNAIHIPRNKEVKGNE